MRRSLRAEIAEERGRHANRNAGSLPTIFIRSEAAERLRLAAGATKKLGRVFRDRRLGLLCDLAEFRAMAWRRRYSSKNWPWGMSKGRFSIILDWIVPSEQTAAYFFSRASVSSPKVSVALRDLPGRFPGRGGHLHFRRRGPSIWRGRGRCNAGGGTCLGLE